MSATDDIQDPPELPENEHQDATAKPEGQGSESAKSSDARDETESGDELLLVAREVIEGKVKKPGEAASSAEQSDAGQDTGSQVRTEKDDENYSDVPFHKHPRFQQVLGRMKSAEVDAERYRNVDRFIQDNGLTADSAAEALTIAALMVNDPAEAWKRLQPALQKLLVSAGEALPPDLQRQVDEGVLPREAALQISRATASVHSVQARQALDQQNRERQQQADHVRSLRTAADTWEADRQARDPNYAAKVPALEREIAWLHRSEGVPSTVAGVQDQLKRAYETVNRDFRPATPAPTRRPTRPVTGGQPVNGSQRPSYGSTLDIVRAKVAGAAAS